MTSNDDRDPKIVKKLKLLDEFPPRSIQMEETRRSAFLLEAQAYGNLITNPVSTRHIGWMQKLSHSYANLRKEHSPMYTTIITILLASSLLLGTGGVTVAAAQRSLPDEPLYGLKIWSEDARLDVITDPTTDFELSLDFANRRIDEITALMESGVIPPTDVLSRYQDQIVQTIQYALNLNRDQTEQALEQVRTRLTIQQQTLLQTKTGPGTVEQAVQQQLQQMLQEHIRLVENGMVDPVMLREQLHLQDKGLYQTLTSTSEPTGSTGQTQSTNGSGNPWTTGTPTPGSGYGPGTGTGDCTACTPAGIGQGGNTYATGTPKPGSSNGSGQNQSTSTTENVIVNGNGIQPTQASPESTRIPGKKGGNH